MDTRTARQEFEQQVLAGELTNIEQYFDDESAQEERYLLAKHGINVDRVIDMDGTDVIVRFIRDSVHKDRYDEWKDHPNKDVRLELAMHGYFLEQYIHDDEPEIRREVMNLRLDLGLERMFNLNDQEVFLGLLMRQRRPNLQILQKYIEEIAPGLEQDSLSEAFRLKYEAMISEPNTFEATMTPAQLYDSGSVLWARKYDAVTIEHIVWYFERLTAQNYQNFTNILFEMVEKTLKKGDVLTTSLLTKIKLKIINSGMTPTRTRDDVKKLSQYSSLYQAV